MSTLTLVVLFALLAVSFVSVALLLSQLIRPHKPNADKNASFESGEQPAHGAWVQFNPRFFIIAILFVLFEVELVLLFPWAVAFGEPDQVAAGGRDWLWLAAVEGLTFIGILLIGFAYAWRYGYLAWPLAVVDKPKVSVVVPSFAYQELAQRLKK